MMVLVTTPELGQWLHHQQDVSAVPIPASFMLLQRWLQANRSRLEPTFPHTTEPNLQIYFQLHSSTPISDAELQVLRGLPGVEGAYEKPSDELPN